MPPVGFGGGSDGAGVGVGCTVVVAVDDATKMVEVDLVEVAVGDVDTASPGAFTISILSKKKKVVASIPQPNPIATNEVVFIYLPVYSFLWACGE